MVTNFHDNALMQRIDALSRLHINELGTDPFGLDPDMLKTFAPFVEWLYRKYFRCEVRGFQHVPEGRVVVIANHSGQLPFDGAMLGAAFLLEPRTPRLLRGMAERWTAELPFISELFARGGHIVGEPSSCRRLLEMEEAVLVFPEGMRGIVKLFRDRYKLLEFGHGFMRLALETRTPVLPVAVVGAEEQAPAIANIAPLARLTGLPAWPLIFPQIIPFPLPVKYHIQVGEPLHFQGDGTEEDHVVAHYVKQAKSQIRVMIDRMRKERKSIFF